MIPEIVYVLNLAKKFKKTHPTPNILLLLKIEKTCPGDIAVKIRKIYFKFVIEELEDIFDEYGEYLYDYYQD